MIGSVLAAIESAYLAYLKRNEFESLRLRRHFCLKHEIDVGLYSYGCFDVQRIARGTVIGRYCSISPTAYILGRNHGVRYFSLHPYFYNESLEFPVLKSIPFERQTVSDGAWIGHNSVILPSCRRVGRGAVVGSGAIVVKDVPDYAIVAGNPARVVKYRFDTDTIKKIESTQWWELSKSELAKFVASNAEFAFDPSNHEVP